MKEDTAKAIKQSEESLAKEIETIEKTAEQKIAEAILKQFTQK